MPTSPRPEFSVIITCYFEEKSIDEFHGKLSAALAALNRTSEIIFVNDGPGLLLGSMWDDYSYIEEVSDDIKVVTLRMISERITLEWLNS